jgi:hypothetical protein
VYYSSQQHVNLNQNLNFNLNRRNRRLAKNRVGQTIVLCLAANRLSQSVKKSALQNAMNMQNLSLAKKIAALLMQELLSKASSRQ